MASENLLFLFSVGVALISDVWFNHRCTLENIRTCTLFRNGTFIPFLHVSRHFKSEMWCVQIYLKHYEHESGNVLSWLLYVLWQFRNKMYTEWHWKRLMLYHVWKSNVPPTLNPTTHLTDSVNKCKQEIKVHLLKQPCLFYFEYHAVPCELPSKFTIL